MPRESKNRIRRRRPRDGKPVDPLATPSQPPFPVGASEVVFDDFIVVRPAAAQRKLRLPE